MFRVLAIHQSNWRNCGLCVGLSAENGSMLMGIWWQEHKNKLGGLKVLIWKRNVCYRVLQLSKLPRYRERQTVMCCLEWLGKSKCLVTGLDVSLSFLSTLWKCSQNQSPVIFLFHQCITFCNKCKLCSKWH